MTNIDKVSMALSEWAFNVAKAALPNVAISPNSTIGHLMGLIGADPKTYNIWNELGFIAEPVIELFVTPAVNQMLGSVPDERVPELAHKIVDSFIEQARKKGGVNLFGFELGESTFQGLKAILTDKMGDNGQRD